MVMTMAFCNIFLWLPCGSGQAGSWGILTFRCPEQIIHLQDIYRESKKGRIGLEGRELASSLAF